MAAEMQAQMQDLVLGWQARGYHIGFGMGLAKGMATVGRIGYEGRLDYTAIGNVVNLAARLCATAKNGQILIDAAMSADLGDAVPMTALGAQQIKGFDAGIVVHEISWRQYSPSQP